MLELDKIQAQLDELEKIGGTKGYLTIKEIEGFFSDADEEFLDSVELYFSNKGIDICRDDDMGADSEDQLDIEIDNLDNLTDDDMPSEEDLDDDLAEVAFSDGLLEEETEIKISDFDPNDQSQFQTDDIVRMYLHEIGSIPLLDFAQETQLATQVQTGLSAQEKLDNAEKQGKELSPEEIRDLKQKIAIGNAARERLTLSNSRLVVAFAKRHTNRGLSLADLITEGNFGLIRAVNKYDPTRGYKFSTYATWWIKQAIQRAIADKGRNVRIPVHMHENINTLAKAKRKLIAELHREPTINELAKELNKTPEKIVELQRVAQDTQSFDMPVGDEEDSTLMDLTADTETLNPLEYTERELRKEMISKVLKTLTPREEMVIRLRYGIDVDKAHTLEEVGTIMNVTRERVRQIEAKAINRLRHNYRSTMIKEDC